MAKIWGGFFCHAIFPFLMLLCQTSWWGYSSLTSSDTLREHAAFLWRYEGGGEHPRNSPIKNVFSHSALANIFLNTAYFAVKCLKTEMRTWGRCMIHELRSSAGTGGRIWGVFSVLIAQGCIILSNQKSLPVCAALIHAAFHTYPLFGPPGQDGSLMDHIPEISW